jgi:SRP54-type protein, GTPase domain
MIAACDTFRSGAVEQLKTHCARLGVPLYERGYEKDPAKVAFEAVRAAERSGTDVVLVDTAGARRSGRLSVCPSVHPSIYLMPAMTARRSGHLPSGRPAIHLSVCLR